MSTVNGPYDPVTVRADGGVVIETHTIDGNRERRQLIFQPIGNGYWHFSVCVPGVGTMLLTEQQVITLSYAMRHTEPRQGG